MPMMLLWRVTGGRVTRNKDEAASPHSAGNRSLGAGGLGGGLCLVATGSELPGAIPGGMVSKAAPD